MFSEAPSASKIALHALCSLLVEKNFDLIDCQQVTTHLLSLGAVPVSRHEFLLRLQLAMHHDSFHENWGKFEDEISKRLI